MLSIKNSCLVGIRPPKDIVTRERSKVVDGFLALLSYVLRDEHCIFKVRRRLLKMIFGRIMTSLEKKHLYVLS